MKKILSVLFVLFIFSLSVCAKGIKSDLSEVITDSNISKHAVSISIKDLNTGKSVYALNEKNLIPPASVQKMLTLPAAIDTLGENYEFSTEIFSRGNGKYLIKLGADPYFSFSDLKTLISKIDDDNVNTVFIDDTIIEKKDWGEGWQWDDDLNIHMPRFNSYNLDDNIIKITIMKDNSGEKTIVINPSKYPLTFLNNVTAGEESDIKISRDNSVSANALTLCGTVNTPVTYYIPLNNLKRYFDFKLRQGLEDRNIYLKNPYYIDKTKSTDKELTRIVHPISEAIQDILKNSNNMASETVMKIASAKAYNHTGTDVDGTKLFNTYCQKLGLNTSGIRIVDASGVSKNNLLYADFITEYLKKNHSNKTLQNLPSPGEGTLSNRMIPLKDYLKAKTGTLSDISGISGYLTSKSGKKYVFSIMINDPNSSEADKKTFEDYFIRELWLKG